MLYEKSKTDHLTDALFKEPTCEYRGAPFWSWNDELEEEECVRQAHIFRDMGFGGYHMHPRSGLATPYLGDKFNSCVRACVEDAKANGMLAWLYDEDRYPSGFAGGAVTKDGRFRRRGLLFTSKKRKEDAVFSEGRQCGGKKLLATYAVKLCLGKCFGYKRLAAGEKGFGKRFYAYLVVDEPTDQFNQAGYVDALCKDALTAFADYTFGTYQKNVGAEFGKTIPAIFTDEPQMKFYSMFKHAICPKEAMIPWTDDFAMSYQKVFGSDILDRLPELFFEMNRPSVKRTRYLYHTHRTERFAEAFSDNLGTRAAALGLALTGHLMEEPTLGSQSRAVGETMRHYKEFGLPGIDMLCGRHEYTTAKQTESVVRQQGKEGMLCELYGVSRWVVEFGKFKEEGDWLACLGVTARVPHLSFYSMRGEAKRDYPPSIFYQSPWYLKFKMIEDHFARLNTALTRGKAVNDVAVIHPIESYFLTFGGEKSNKKMRARQEARFQDLANWLLFSGCDFDYISESLLPSQVTEDALAVGQCRYKKIFVPALTTMRRTTLDYLVRFRKAGGEVVFLGGVPSMIEGVASDDVIAFAKTCKTLAFEKQEVLGEIEDHRVVTLTSECKPEKYLTTLREDNDGKWLFVCSPRVGFPYPHSVPVTNEQEVVKDRVRIGLKGNWKVTEYDTMTGEIRPLPCKEENGVTYVTKVLYNNDSLLLHYQEGASEECGSEKENKVLRTLPLDSEAMRYTLDEPNVLLLDKAKWSVDGRYHARTDLDRITRKARKALGLSRYRTDLQPWLREAEGEKSSLSLLYSFDSEVTLPAHFACEYKEFTLTVNGEKITAPSDGFYVDAAFRTYPIQVKEGQNRIELTIPMGKYDCCENCYLLGAFGVKASARKASLLPLPETITFGDIRKQLFPFYSGKLIYHTTFEGVDGKAEITAKYASALLTMWVNGSEKDVLFAPYSALLPIKKGSNTLAITAYISRENAFGAVHIRRKYKRSDSPSWFHKLGLPWRVRAYVLDQAGILEPPVVKVVEE